MFYVDDNMPAKSKKQTNKKNKPDDEYVKKWIKRDRISFFFLVTVVVDGWITEADIVLMWNCKYIQGESVTLSSLVAS